MKENIESISAIWKDGQKSVAECAELIYDFLQLLKNHNPNLFGKWYKKSSSKRKAIDQTVAFPKKGPQAPAPKFRQMKRKRGFQLRNIVIALQNNTFPFNIP